MPKRESEDGAGPWKKEYLEIKRGKYASDTTLRLRYGVRTYPRARSLSKVERYLPSNHDPATHNSVIILEKTQILTYSFLGLSKEKVQTILHGFAIIISCVIRRVAWTTLWYALHNALTSYTKD